MNEPRRPEEFTDRELALLDAWDEHNSPSPEDRFEARLLAGYARAEEASLHADEAHDAAICKQLAADAEIDGTSPADARAREAPLEAAGSSAVAAAPFEEALRDEVAARRRVRRWAYVAVAAVVAAAAMVTAVLWSLGDGSQGVPDRSAVMKPAVIPVGGDTLLLPPQDLVILPSPNLVATVIGVGLEGAQVEVQGTGQVGPAPFAAELRRGKRYVARLTAPCFAPFELGVVGGNDVSSTELMARRCAITVDSNPAGALITIDGVSTGHTTPFEIELTTNQLRRKTVRIQVRKPGFRPHEKIVEVAKLSEGDVHVTVALDPAPVNATTATPGANRSVVEPRVPARRDRSVNPFD